MKKIMLLLTTVSLIIFNNGFFSISIWNNQHYFNQEDNYFDFNNKKYTQARIDGINGVFRNAIKTNKSNNMTYFGTYYGVYVLKSGEVKANKIKGIDDKIISLITDNNGNIFFGTEDNGVYLYKTDDESITKIDGIDNNDIKDLALDSNGNLYIGTLNGIFYLTIGDTTAIKEAWGNEQIFSLALDEQDNLYYATASKMAYYVEKGTNNNVVIPGINTPVYAITSDNQNNIYLGSYVYKIGNTQADEIAMVDKTIVSIAVDQENNVYYCSLTDGIYFLKTGANAVIKTTEFGISGQAISIDKNANIFVNNNEGSYVFQIYSPTPPEKENNVTVVKVVGYVFLSATGAVGVSFLGTYLWNKYRYKNGRKKKR